MSDITNIGDPVRIFGTLLVDNVPTDPSSLRLVITTPDGTETEYLWNVDPEIVRSSEGQFYHDFSANAPGVWTYSWFSNSNLTAFKTASITVAWPTSIESVDDAAVAVPFVSVRLWNATNGQACDLGIDPQRTDANGVLSTSLPPGSYRVHGFKVGWVYEPAVLIDLSGDGPYTITLEGRLMQSNWLQWEDLECSVDKATIDRLFNDDNTGIRDMQLIEGLIQQAEALAESKLLRSWSREDIYTLAREDKALRGQAAWIAIEMATERKSEFIASDGKGRFWAQYSRAIEFFDALSKSKIHSRGEVAAGNGHNSGGGRRPKLRTDQDPFIFAPGRNGRGPGGF